MKVRWNWMINFLLESPIECPYVSYVPPLLRGRPHLVRDTAAENWSTLVQRSNKIEMDEKSNF